MANQTTDQANTHLTVTVTDANGKQVAEFVVLPKTSANGSKGFWAQDRPTFRNSAGEFARFLCQFSAWEIGSKNGK